MVCSGLQPPLLQDRAPASDVQGTHPDFGFLAEHWPLGGPRPQLQCLEAGEVNRLPTLCSFPKQRLLRASILPVVGLISQSRVPHLCFSGSRPNCCGLWQVPRGGGGASGCFAISPHLATMELFVFLTTKPSGVWPYSVHCPALPGLRGTGISLGREAVPLLLGT